MIRYLFVFRLTVFAGLNWLMLMSVVQASELADAVQSQSAFHAERCLRSGADPNEVIEGVPLLVHAVRAENYELSRVLLQHGADPDVNMEMDDPFLTLKPTENRDQLALKLLLRTWRFLNHHKRPPQQSAPSRPGLVVLAEPTVDYTHPQLAPHYYVNVAERDGQPGTDDDDDGFIDNVYGWGMVADRPHEVTHWQRQLYTDDASLIEELVEISNRVERGELSRDDPSFQKLSSSFRNPIAALFGASYGLSDATFMDKVVELSHGTHVGGIVLKASGDRALLHTVSWENFGPYSEDVLGYPPVTSGDPFEWLEAVRKHRFPKLIAIGHRCTDYLRAVDASLVNASFHLTFQARIDQALQVVNEMRLFDKDLPDDTVTLLANELYAYSTIPHTLAVAENPQILFVAAAGNDRHDIDATFDSFATLSRLFPNVIAVAASGINGGLASFSNVGRKSVNLAAPGENIESYGIANTRMVMSGTSQAAPVVTGFAAGYRIEHPDVDVPQLARLIEMAATRPADQQALMVSSGGSLDPSQITALQNDDPTALVELTWRLIDTNPGRHPELWVDAWERIRSASEKLSEHAELQWATAILGDQVGLGQESLNKIEQAVALDPTQPAMWFSRGLIQWRANEFVKVIETIAAFETQFAGQDTPEIQQARRDLAALGVDACTQTQETDKALGYQTLYESAVTAVGRANGAGTPNEDKDNGLWQAHGHLHSVDLPADSPTIFHRYVIHCDEATPVQVDLHTATFDGYLAVVSHSDVASENDDYMSDIHHSQIVIDKPESGNYAVIVMSVRGRDTGPYTLDITGAELLPLDEGVVLPRQHRR
ncbi:MAG TPA: S8 family serine peptidase [Planctomycetaceae bacterium]|nr:S8 family serine peptidase [Planctomycetaceae bacterium]